MRDGNAERFDLGNLLIYLLDNFIHHSVQHLFYFLGCLFLGVCLFRYILLSWAHFSFSLLQSLVLHRPHWLSLMRWLLQKCWSMALLLDSGNVFLTKREDWHSRPHCGDTPKSFRQYCRQSPKGNKRCQEQYSSDTAILLHGHLLEIRNEVTLRFFLKVGHWGFRIGI